jgi:N-acetylmuramoyl-L-alanine amidase
MKCFSQKQIPKMSSMRFVWLPLILIFLSFFFSRQGYRMAAVLMHPADTVTVVIDAGHGGTFLRKEGSL